MHLLAHPVCSHSPEAASSERTDTGSFPFLFRFSLSVAVCHPLYSYGNFVLLNSFYLFREGGNGGPGLLVYADSSKSARVK